MKYFAYGSNMSLQRLKERGIKASVIGVFPLVGHVLKFHKKSQDNSGKCDAFYTGKDSDKMYGVLYEINRSEKDALDGYEGLGKGYCEKCIEVKNKDGVIEKAFTYCAKSDCIDNAWLPWEWYRNHVLTGAEEHGLPPEYIEKIKTVKTKKCKS